MDPTDRYIESVEHLAPAPTIATQLLDLFKNEYQNVDRIVELISYDPSLTAEVLKRCNSAFFRGREPVSDMFQAVTRVGFYEVYCVVVSMLASRTMGIAQNSHNIDSAALWQHSVIAAVATGSLSRHAQENEAAAFTAALLHDVGKLILISAEPEIYSKIIAEAGMSGPVFLEMERSMLGVTHAAVGARLLARWGLPPNVDVAVLNHHSSPFNATSFERFAAIVAMADILGHMFSNGKQVDSAALLSPVAVDSMKILRLAPEKMEPMMVQIDRGLRRVDGLLNLVTPAGGMVAAAA